MKFENTEKLDDNNFKLLTGINRKIFNKMIENLKISQTNQRQFGGRKNKLSIENRLLMALEYWREYHTYFYIAFDFLINKSTCIQNIHWIENTLMKHHDFQQFNKKKSLLMMTLKIKQLSLMLLKVLSNAQKKTKNDIILERRKNIQ